MNSTLNYQKCCPEKTPGTFICWSMWLLAAIFYALDYFQHTAPSVLLKPIAFSLHLDPTTIGSIMSIYFPIYAIAQIPAGIILDRYRIGSVLGVACIIVSFGLLTMVSGSESMVIAGRVLIAFGSSFAFLGALKTASMWLSDGVFPIVVGMTNTIGVLGGILGQSFLNHLILTYHWQHAIIFIGLFGFGLAFLLLILLRGKTDCRPVGVKLPLDFSILKDYRIWLLAIYAAIMVGTVVNAFSELYDVAFLETAFGLGSQQAANISIMVFIGIAVGGPCHGFIAKFIGKKPWMMLGCLLTIIMFSGIIVSTNVHLPVTTLYVLYFLVGFFVSSMLLSFAMVRSHYSESQTGMGFALVNMIIGVGGFTFQFLLSEVIHWISPNKSGFTQHDFTIGFIVLLIPLIISLILCSIPRYKLKS